MKIYPFRHGQTASNAVRRYLGVTDEPLSEPGIETARAAGSDAAVEQVLVTPLKRTQMTAALLFPNAEQTICPGLREMDFGDFEGRSAQEMADDPDYRYWVEQTQCMGPCPHGEARLVFQHRVCASFQREVERARQAGQESLYLVIHGGSIMAIMSRFGRPEAPYFNWRPNNCQGYRCEANWNDGDLFLTDICRLDKVCR